MSDIVDILRNPRWSIDNEYKVRNSAANEIERLRAATKKQANMIVEQEVEIERLRGLLREAEKMWPNPGISTESSQWYRRVREALGE